MRGTVPPEEVITLATLKKITVAAYLSPVRTDFLPVQPKLFPVCST